jgi:hypothetical protein
MQGKLKERPDVWKGDAVEPRPLRVHSPTPSLHDMQQRDYLLRQIEALGRILSRLREMITGGATAAAKSELQAEMRNVGLELSMANSLDPATLLMLLGGPKLDERRAFAVGALLHVDGLRAQTDGDAAWAARSFKAAETLLLAVRPQLDPERAAIADEVLAALRESRSAGVGDS